MSDGIESANGQSAESTTKPIIITRVWPALLVCTVQLCGIAISVTPEISGLVRFIVLIATPVVCALAFSVVLTFASRLGYRITLPVIVTTAAMGAIAAQFAAHRTATAYWFYGVPLVMLMVTAGMLLSRRTAAVTKRWTLIFFAAIGWATISAVRIEGIDGSYVPQLALRWMPTAEQQLLEELDAKSPPGDAAALEWSAASLEWPGFRGPNRDSRVTEPLPELDWEKTPPKEVWRRAVGPAWSSMTVVSGRLFTQEQRGSVDTVVCYDAASGDSVWIHEEASRFEEMTSGAGPRATPTYHDGRLYCYTAKGILVSLDAATGDLLWRHDLMEEVNAQLPIWGFASSPEVFSDLVVVYAGGDGDNGLMAFDLQSGDTRWAVAERGMNFGSAQRMRFEDQDTLVFSSGGSVMGIEPSTGDQLWRQVTNPDGQPPIVQPQQLDETDMIVPLGDGVGVARLTVSRDGDQWNVEERWRSRNMKASFNDYLLVGDAMFGFDKNIFACVNLNDGSRNWKRGRYGFGQALLLEASGQIIVIAETGETVLLDADASGLRERGRLAALEGKTWNHPAVANGKLYVRNAEEMACYDLIAD